MSTPEFMPGRAPGGAARKRSMGLLFALAAVCAVGAVMAYKALSNRPGEAAIHLIPADALMVITVDTQPSAQQVPLFTRIDDALKKEGLDKKLDEMLMEMMEKSPIAADIRKHITQNFAFAVLPVADKKATPEFVAFMEVDDAQAVATLLAKDGAKDSVSGETYYNLKKIRTSAALVANYLVLTDKPANLGRIFAVRGNPSKSLASLPTFQEARAALPEDANFMFFAGPGFVDMIQEQTKSLTGASSQPAPNFMKWMAMSATMRDKGIQFDVKMPVDVSKMPSMKAFNQIAAMDDAAFKKMPGGAYGVMGMSQASHYWNYLTEIFDQTPEMKKSIDEGIAEVEKQTGIDLEKQVLPAFEGNAWVGFYPDSEEKDSMLDMMILLDDANGADPAALAAAVRAAIEKQSATPGSTPIKFVSAEAGGSTVYRLDSKTEAAMQKGITDAAGQVSEGFMSSVVPGGRPGGAPSSSFGEDPFRAPSAPSPQQPKQAAPGQDEVTKMLKGKSFLHAQIGKAVILASSQRMLDRAVASYSGHQPSLVDDPAFKALKPMMTAGTQQFALVNFARIMERFRPMIEEAMKDTPKGITADDLCNMFGGIDSAMVSTGHYRDDASTARFFMPLDFERMIHLMGEGARQFIPPPGARGGGLGGGTTGMPSTLQ